MSTGLWPSNSFLNLVLMLEETFGQPFNDLTSLLRMSGSMIFDPRESTEGRGLSSHVSNGRCRGPLGRRLIGVCQTSHKPQRDWKEVKVSRQSLHINQPPRRIVNAARLFYPSGLYLG